MSPADGGDAPRWIVHGEPSPGEAIRAALAVARRRLRMEVAFVSEFTAGQRMFRYVDAGIDACPVEVGAGDPLEESFCQRVVDGRLPELMADAREVAAARELAVTEALPVGAHASVPIRLGDGRIYGTFCCFSRVGRDDLTVDDLEVMRTLADFVAEQVEHELAAEARRGSRRTENQQAFIQSVSHEFRTPLTVIQGTAEILRGRREVDPEMADELLDGLTAASSRLAELVQRVVDTADVLASEEHRRPAASLRLEAHEVVRSLGAAGRVFVHDVPDVAPRIDERRLQLVLQAIIEHALHHAGVDGPIDLIGGRRGTVVELVIRYRTLGVEALPGVGPGDQAASGAGVRLLLARTLVNQAGGDLRFRLDRPDHAEVRVVLPVEG